MKQILTAIILLLAIGASSQDSLVVQNPYKSDLNGDGCVTSMDLTQFLVDYGQCNDSAAAPLDIIPRWNIYYLDTPNPNTVFDGLHELNNSREQFDSLYIYGEVDINYFYVDSLGSETFISNGYNMIADVVAMQVQCHNRMNILCRITHNGWIYENLIGSQYILHFIELQQCEGQMDIVTPGIEIYDDQIPLYYCVNCN